MAEFMNEFRICLECQNYKVVLVSIQRVFESNLVLLVSYQFKHCWDVGQNRVQH